MEARNLPNQDTDNLAGEVMDSLGEPTGAAEDISNEISTDGTDAENSLPGYAKEKLGKMQKRHQRDLRRLQDEISSLRGQLGSNKQSFDPMGNSSNAAENPTGDEHITRAISLALEQKDKQEREARARQAQAQEEVRMQKQYQNFQKDLDKASDKYDDFDEVVMGDDVPITKHIRDTAALLTDNPGETLYRLGKNRQELERIASLPPEQQAREVIKLSTALMSGESKTQQQPRTLGQVKSSPVSSQAVTEKTSPSEIRARMKSGLFK